MKRSPAWRLHFSAPLVALLSLLLIGAISLPGCGGCQKETVAQKKKRLDEEKKKEAERKKKKRLEEPKPNFDPVNTQILPNLVTSNPPGKDKDKEKEKDKAKEEQQVAGMEYSYVKPGHWVSAMQTLKANNFDFPGLLRTYPADANGRPLDVFKTNYRVSMFRPASLPKGQAKFIETTYFLPLRESMATQILPVDVKKRFTRYNIRVELLSSRGGSVQATDSVMGTSLSDYEYFIVVLAGNASSYGDLRDPKKMRSVVVNESEIAEGGSLRYYHVVLPKIDRRAPLPSNPFAWTAIAYVIWDDLDPAILTAPQQGAMLDWIHWGGQLIISGPNSLDKLKGSFLAPYLPAESGQALKLEQSAFDELNQNWSPASKSKTAEQRKIKLVADKPMLGVELKKHPLADFLEGTGNLLVERRVGGGRIVTTGFPLTDLRIRYWPGFDGFFNGCLLRRPARRFDKSQLDDLKMTWATPGLESYVRDPRISSTLRYFSRDVGYPKGQTIPTPVSPVSDRQSGTMAGKNPYLMQPDFVETPAEITVDKHPEIDDWHFGGYRADTEAGVGGWSDLTPAATAARESLADAGKIAIPKADFVLRVLAIYLLMLVPVNWLVFWLIGRVEWAWAAAPIIAIIGAVCVIRLAQLNIGFVRSRTEVAVLEVQGGYPRAHVTRYTTLYTSLSTGYDLSYDDPSAVALPFVTKTDFVRQITDTPKYVDYRQDKNTVLSGVQVNSNSTEKIHSEHMLELQGAGNKPGGLSLARSAQTGWTLRNDTPFTLHDVGVLRRNPARDLETVYIAELKPGTSAPLTFALSGESEPWVARWDQSLVMSSKVQEQEEDKGTVRLYRLVELAAKQLRLAPGDVRLIAWTDDALPGMKVYPAPAQNNTRTLVLTHLARAKIPPPQHDQNFVEDLVLPETEEELKPPEEGDPNARAGSLKPAYAAQNP